MAILKHDEICQMLPHAGDMCLLDEVIAWDKGSIECVTESHRNNQNPLFNNGRLHAINCIEYAGQATVVHGTLCWEEGMDLPNVAILVSIRDLKIKRSILNDIEAPLHIHADVLDILEFASNYSFNVTADGMEIASGRLTSKLIFNEK